MRGENKSFLAKFTGSVLIAMFIARLVSSFSQKVHPSSRNFIRFDSVRSFRTSLGLTNENGGTVSDAVSVGFIGLGLMGDGMARRLLRSGHSLRVWNRSEGKSRQLQTEFVENVIIDECPRDVVKNSDIVFMMLSTPEASKAVYDGDNGLLAGISKGKCIVDCATLQPCDMVEASAQVNSKGGIFLEAPVSGSKVPAETGQLIFLAAGDETLYKRSLPFFGVMGKSSHFLGPVGEGTRMKLVVNSIMANMLAALAEGMALTKATGLSQQSLLQILSEGAMNNPMFTAKGPRMISGDHPPNFPLKHAHKDLLFAINMAKELHVNAKVSEASDVLYSQAMTDGLGDADFAAVANVTGGK